MMARTITKIIIHCADTPANVDIGVEEIRRWHNIAAFGWIFHARKAV
jgi:hypothetical protein